MVTVNDILDAGLLANGKLPDIYWELNLSGTELKVLRYVYSNCLRLYRTLPIFPKGKDGSPRFWRGKEKMADDCGMSYPTFRKSVRNLYSLGVLTSMDGIEDEDEIYCIGLKPDFLNSGLLQTEKNFRLHSKKELLLLLYNKDTVELIEISLRVEIENNPSVTNVTELVEHQGKPKKSHVKVKSKKHTTASKLKTEIVRVPIIMRTPVTGFRKHISVIPKTFNLQFYQEKRRQLHHIRAASDNKILEIASYYEYKARTAIGASGFRVLGKNYKEHKNWKFLEKLYKLCEDNHWDYKVYIDAQFDRVRFYQRKQDYPYLNQFFSEGAINAYHRYVKDYKEKYSTTGNARVKTEKVQSFAEQVADKIVNDCERMSTYMKSASKRRSTSELTAEQVKIVYISEHWMGLSYFYLSSIPWFITYLDQLPKEQYVEELSEHIRTIQKSKSLSDKVTNIVRVVESQMDIPPTMLLEQ